MALSIMWLIIGVGLLYIGAELLVKGSASLAIRCGVSSLVAGLTVVAFGTSAPELVVRISSGLKGLGDLAVGNAVGSNIFNIAVILGITAVLLPLKVNRSVLRFDAPIMIGISAILLMILRDAQISRIEGLFLVAGIVTYTTTTIALSRKGSLVSIAPEIEALTGDVKKKSVFWDIGFVISGLGLLIFGSKFFVRGAVEIAELLKIPEAIIGLTIVAAGTSLPELATSIVAAIKKEADIAIGNIIGSNIFNIFAILGISSVITPLNAQGVAPMNLYLMFGIAVILFPFMRSGYSIGRIKGAVLVAIYGGYMFYIWPR
jgi:cation:H+ antiporter